MAASPPPPTWAPSPTWGPPSVPVAYPPPATTNVRGSASLLVVAVILHVFAALVVWVLIDLAIRNASVTPEAVSILHLLAAIGVVGQLVFAAIAGVGAYFFWKGGANVAGVGTGLLVTGIIALIFSVVVSGGIIGLAAGALTAYAGNKARKRPPPMWIAPPGSWMPPQPPTQPPPGP